jgi:hypothetical protein
VRTIFDIYICIKISEFVSNTLFSGWGDVHVTDIRIIINIFSIIDIFSVIDIFIIIDVFSNIDNFSIIDIFSSAVYLYNVY